MGGNFPLEKILSIGEDTGFSAVALSFHDYEKGVSFSWQGDRWFHAASTFKAAILLALFDAVHKAEVRLEDYLHVRNRFHSAVDGSIFRTDAKRDGEPTVYTSIGHCLQLRELAKAMIVRSSNLATNLLIDYLTVERVQRFLQDYRVEGLRVLRGVEDEKAFTEGINNEVTADGLVSLFKLLCSEDFLHEEARAEIRDILLAQEFKRMIPAQLPDHAEVAHKTGEISTVCHDAGLVYTPDTKPYVISILTEADETVQNRKAAVAAISSAVFKFLRPSEKETEL